MEFIGQHTKLKYTTNETDRCIEITKNGAIIRLPFNEILNCAYMINQVDEETRQSAIYKLLKIAMVK